LYPDNLCVYVYVYKCPTVESFDCRVVCALELHLSAFCGFWSCFQLTIGWKSRSSSTWTTSLQVLSDFVASFCVSGYLLACFYQIVLLDYWHDTVTCL